jgi:hypothetical protein
MAISKGNITSLNPTVGITNSYTQPHTQNTGSDRVLVVVVCHKNNVTTDSVTYNGTAMTQLSTHNATTPGNRYYAFYLEDPDTGANDVVINWSGNLSTSIALCIQSFTGAGTPTSAGVNGLANSPHIRSLTISAGSVIFGAGQSIYTISTVTLDGNSTVSPNYDIDASVEGDRFTGEFSAVIGTAGSKDVEIDTAAPSFQTANYRFEVPEASVAPPATRRRIFVV